MRIKANNYFLKSFEEIGLIGKHFDVYDNNDNLVFENCYINDKGYVCYGEDDRELWATTMSLLTGEYSYKITSKKKKLRDITEEEFKNWMNKNCFLGSDCNKCIFNNVYCSAERNWINHKDIFSDKFLNQEIEVEE